MENTYNKCIICENNSYGKPQCKICWMISMSYCQELEGELCGNINYDTIKPIYKEKIKQCKKNPTRELLCELIGIGFIVEETKFYNNIKENVLNSAYESVIKISKTTTKIKGKTETITLAPIYLENPKENLNEIKDKETIDFRKRYPCEKRCQDGHYVRTETERTIDNFLYSTAKLLHAYEKKFNLTEAEIEICKKAGKNYDCFYPDFYIPKLNLYLEYFGKNDEEYNQKMELKIKIFTERKEINFAYLTTKDKNNIEEHLEDIITQVHNKIKKENH